jgi:hypothetical protein
MVLKKSEYIKQRESLKKELINKYSRKIDALLNINGNATIDIEPKDMFICEQLKDLYIDAGWSVTITKGSIRDCRGVVEGYSNKLYIS